MLHSTILIAILFAAANRAPKKSITPVSSARARARRGAALAMLAGSPPRAQSPFASAELQWRVHALLLPPGAPLGEQPQPQQEEDNGSAAAAAKLAWWRRLLPCATSASED
jgi:hypothetical protein